MRKRLSGLSITMLYEGGGGQQVTVPGPRSGRIQRRKEIPEATQKKKKNGWRCRRETHRQGGDEDDGMGRVGTHQKEVDMRDSERMQVCLK